MSAERGGCLVEGFKMARIAGEAALVYGAYQVSDWFGGLLFAAFLLGHAIPFIRTMDSFHDRF